MKLTHLTGIWKETADAYMQDIASEIIGYSYSQYCMGYSIDRNTILEETKQLFPPIQDLQLEPFTVILQVGDAGRLRIKYRSQGMTIGYTFTIER